MTRKTATPTLASAMRILARQIQSQDGVANAAIAEAAERLDELHIINGEMLATMTRVYQMLLTEPDTKGALFKAENILHDAIAQMAEWTTVAGRDKNG